MDKVRVSTELEKYEEVPDLKSQELKNSACRTENSIKGIIK